MQTMLLNVPTQEATLLVTEKTINNLNLILPTHSANIFFGEYIFYPLNFDNLTLKRPSAQQNTTIVIQMING